MKKLLALVLALVMVLSLAACGSKEETAEVPAAAENGPVKVVDADSLNDVATQSSNINNFYTQSVKYQVVNNINNSAIAEIIEQAEEEGAALIFANSNSPTDEEFEIYENVYHVSSVATQSGTIMGEALVEYWNENPSADRNGNGKLDYVMLLGKVVLRNVLDTALGNSCAYLATVTEANICLLLFVEKGPVQEQQKWVSDVLRVALDKLNRTLQLSLRAGVGGIYTRFLSWRQPTRRAYWH